MVYFSVVLTRTEDGWDSNDIELDEVDNLGAVMSLIVSTGGFALLPAYAKTFLSDSITSRPLRGIAPKIDLSIGYRKANPSPMLKLFLSRAGELAPAIRGGD